MAEGSDVEIVVAVVVVVADSAAHAIHLNVEAGLFGDVGECSVVVVAIECRVGLALRVAGPIHRVDKEDVLPAVVVVVDEADAAAHGFRKILFAESAAVAREMDSCLRSDVGELNGTRGAN